MKSLPSNNAAAKAVAKLTPGAAEPESLKDQARYALDEARMVLPGIQALFGFQLIAVFSDRFTHALTRTDQLLHLASVFLVALAVALVMTPAAYHRQADHQTVDRQFIRLSSTAITAAMLPLMLAIGLDVYIVAQVILDSAWPSVALAIGITAVFVALWFVLPHSAPYGGRSRPTPAARRR